MRPNSDHLLHFSEDATIDVFTPHVAATAHQSESYVWTVNAEQAPAYWFPRQCPRAMAWTTPTTTTEDAERILGPGGGTRVHAIEYGWLDRIRRTRLFVYRLPRDPFTPIGDPEPYAYVSTRTVRPLGPPEPVGDLFALHESEKIQLRVLPRLHDFWAAVIDSTLGFSGIRLRNAMP